MLKAISTHTTHLINTGDSIDIDINANEVIVFNNSASPCLFDGEVIQAFEELYWGSLAGELVIYEKNAEAHHADIADSPLDPITLIIKQVVFQNV